MGCTRESIVEAVVKRFPSTLSTESLNKVKAIAMDLASKAVVELPMVHKPSEVLSRLTGKVSKKEKVEGKAEGKAEVEQTVPIQLVKLANGAIVNGANKNASTVKVSSIEELASLSIQLDSLMSNVKDIATVAHWVNRFKELGIQTTFKPISITLVNGLVKGKDLAVAYGNDSIHLNTDYSKYRKEADKYGESKPLPLRIVLHEYVHIITQNALADKNNETAKKMIKLYNRVKGHASLKGERGIVDVAEFVAEAIANDRFKEKLDRIAGENKIVNKVKELFKELLKGLMGTKSEAVTALDEVLDLAHTLIQENSKYDNKGVRSKYEQKGDIEVQEKANGTTRYVMKNTEGENVARLDTTTKSIYDYLKENEEQSAWKNFKGYNIKNKDVVGLDMVETYEGFEKQGYASQLLDKFIEDNRDKDIWLDAYPMDNETDGEKLEKWYESRGFKLLDPSKDLRIMVREKDTSGGYTQTFDKLQELFPAITNDDINRVTSKYKPALITEALNNLSMHDGTPETLPFQYSLMYVDLLEHTSYVNNVINMVSGDREKAKVKVAEAMSKYVVEGSDNLVGQIGIVKKLWNYIVKVFEKVFSNNVTKSSNELFNRKAAFLATRMLDKINEDGITLTPKNGTKLVDPYYDFKHQPFASSVVKAIREVSKGEAVFTGSEALAMQGNIYRKQGSNGTDLHDLDFRVPTLEVAHNIAKGLSNDFSVHQIYDIELPKNPNLEKMVAKAVKSMPAAVVIAPAVKATIKLLPKKVISTYIVLPKDLTVANVVRTRGTLGRVISYDIMNKSNEVVGKYSATVENVPGSYKTKIVEEQYDGVKAVLLDLMEHPQKEKTSTWKMPDGTPLTISHPESIFEAKNNLSSFIPRDKDVIDFNSFYNEAFNHSPELKQNNSTIQPKESTANSLVEAAKGCAK